jgi:argininosuccinate synthase
MSSQPARHILLPRSGGTEEMMKREWQIRRATEERLDARQRWDRAYQNILRWSLEAEWVSDPSVNGKKEEYHAGSDLRPGLDLQAGQAPDD